MFFAYKHQGKVITISITITAKKKDEGGEEREVASP